MFLLTVIGSLTLFYRKRRRRLRAKAVLRDFDGKPKVDHAPVVPPKDIFIITKAAYEDRQELEGSSPMQAPTNSAAELRAGPYSNRHELEDYQSFRIQPLS